MTDQLASLHEKQKAFQAVHKFVHLKTPADRITSVLIPTVLCGAAAVLIVSKQAYCARVFSEACARRPIWRPDVSS